MTWEVRDLTVAFGATTALDAVDLVIEEGVIHSVIGGDGAGKSTLLRVLAGLDVGQTGTVRLPAPARIGFVPSAGGIFGDLTVLENLEFVADAYRLRGWRPRADMLLDRMALDTLVDRIAGRMSGGQRRKLAGIMALLSQPDLVVLDELTTGIDPVSRMELWRLIAGAATGGAAVVASTSYLDEAERAGSVLLLHHGHMLASGDPRSITAAVPGSITDCATPSDRRLAWRRAAPGGSGTQNAPTAAIASRSKDAAIVFELTRNRQRR